MNKRETTVKYLNIFCAVIMAALIVLQFVPFWGSVSGVHMTIEEKDAMQATYVPLAERPTTAPAATTPATTAPATTAEPTTEATTAPATEETTAPVEAEATEAATEATESAATEATESAATEATKKPPKKPSFKNQGNDKKGDGPIKNTIPTVPTDAEFRDVSIARAVWLTTEYKKGSEAPLLMFHVMILFVGAVGIFFCLVRNKAKLNFVWILMVGISATMGYFLNEAAQTGANWILHGILSALLVIPGLILLYFWISDIIKWMTQKS